MKPDYLRLSEFAAWVGETKAAMRGLLVRSEVPFDPQTTDGSQRTYDGADLLAWCLFVQLRRLGITPRAAAQAVTLSGAVDQFFETSAQGGDTSDLHLIFWIVRRENDASGKFEVPNQILGSSDDAAAIMREESKEFGRVTYGGDTRLGLVSLVTVPVTPCLTRCQDSAKSHGFLMKGPDLFEIEG